MYDNQLIHEVTLRTIDGALRYPSENKALTAEILGAFGTAQFEYPVRIHAMHFLDNHYHAIYSSDEAATMAGFLNHLHAGLARIANQWGDRVGPIWMPRAHVLPIVADERAQLSRLRYVMGQAVRAKKVKHPRDFLGASSLAWQLAGTPVFGKQFNRTQFCLDNRQKSIQLERDDYTKTVPVKFTPLPALAHLPMEQVHALYRAIANDIASEGVSEAEHAADNSPLAAACVVADPFSPLDDETDDCELAIYPHPSLPGSGSASNCDQAAPTISSLTTATGKVVARTAAAPKKCRPKFVHAATRAQIMEFKQVRAEFDDRYDDARRRQLAEAARVFLGFSPQSVVFPPWCFPSAPPVESGPRWARLVDAARKAIAVDGLAAAAAV
ncbi:MAG: hypothetical protein EXR77_13850 [Myxococcales bacterium]|nr:hypothetical protein [Myxococcales bacterium]